MGDAGPFWPLYSAPKIRLTLTNCLNLAKKGYPEDITNFAATTGSDQFATNASIPSDVIGFTMFMKLLAPPTP